MRGRHRFTPSVLAALCFACAALAEGGRGFDPDALIGAAKLQIGKTVIYDGSYRRIPYPGGDVPIERGVCTDVLIRAFRALGMDLQALVHEDMARAFGAYPKLWGLSRPDSNIDHRRVQNLMVFFKRRGWSLPVTRPAADYLPGDIVTWRLPSGQMHIGLVSSSRAPSAERLQVIHNIGQGAREEDSLFLYPITGHYRLPRVLP